METAHPPLTVDLDRIIAAKSPKMAKYTPKFLIGLLKRIIHQDEINRILLRHGEKTGKDFADATLREMNVACRLRFVNPDSFVPEGRYLFVSNHPLGGLDGLILISELGKRFGEIRFVVNDLLMNLKPLEPVFVPVNKHGSMTKDYTERIREAYESNARILYFPAGLCSRLIGGEIRDTEWKPNFIKQAVRYDRAVVPVYFSGRNSRFFYRLARWRKRLGIRFNLEMLFLPDEMFRQKNTTFDVIIGEPIPAGTFTAEKRPAEWCRLVRERAYSLKKYISPQTDQNKNGR